MCVVTAAMLAPAGMSAAEATATFGTMATMMNISTAMSLVGTGVSAFGQYQQCQQQAATAKANANIAKANAQVAEKKAADAEYRGVLERQKISLQEESMKGQGRTTYAAGNVQLGSGSPVTWEVDLAERAAADKRMSKYNAAVEAWGYRTNASSSRYQAALYNASASNYASSGMLGAGTSLLAGAGKVADKYYTYTKG